MAFMQQEGPSTDDPAGAKRARAKNVDISKSGFPERLRRIRESKNVPPSDLAEKAGVSTRTLHDIEAGRRSRVQANTIHSLAKALGVSYTYLRYGSRRRRYVAPFGVVALVLITIALMVVWRYPNSPDDSPPQYRPSVTTSSPEALQQFVLGDEALKKLNREEAKAHFRTALEIDSTFVMACVRLTDGEIRGTRTEARLLIQQAERHSRKVTDRERQYLKSRAKLVEGDMDGAITELERLADDNPGDKDAFVLLGKYYDAQMEVEKAISCFEKALEIDPQDARSWNNLAYAKERVDDVEGALRASDEYIKALPHEHNPHDTRGDILARNGRPDEAILAFKESLKLRPDFYPSMQYLGCIYLLKRDYARATSYFEDMTLTKDVGARGRGRLFAAAVRLYQGQLDDAMAALNAGLAADRLDNNNNQDHHHKMRLKAFIFSERGEDEDAVAQSEVMLTKVRESDPRGLAEWLDDHVYFLVRAKRFDEALAAVDSCEYYVVEAAGHRTAYYWMARGWVDYERGDLASACSHFEQANAQEPKFYHGYPLGLAYLKAGRVDEAARLFEKLSLRFNDERVAYPIEAVKLYYYLGVAYQESGQPQKAAAMYKKFLDIWKDADPVFNPIKSDARRRLSQVVS